MCGPGSVPIQPICWALSCISGGLSLEGGGGMLIIGLVGLVECV